MPFNPEMSVSARARCGRAAVVVLLGAVLLAGCFPLALTGAAVGTMAVADRRTIGAQTEDQEIEVKALRIINQMPDGRTNASATSYNRKLLLTGQADSDATKKTLDETLRREIPNLREIYDELRLAQQIGFLDHTKDAAMTARVKTQLLRERSLTASAFKVITEASNVYLMGIVTEEEGDKAALIASRLSGVERVITLFEYVTPAELLRIRPLGSAQTAGGSMPADAPAR